MIPLWLILAAAAVLASGFYSGCETGMYCLNRIRLRLRADSGERRARRLQHLLRDEQNLLAVALVGTNAANYVATAVVARLFAEATGFGDRPIELLTAAAVTPTLFVFGEVVPKNLFQRAANKLMYSAAPGLALSETILRVTGISRLLKMLARCLVARIQPGQLHPHLLHPRHEVVALLREGLAEGIMTSQQSELIDRVMNLLTVHVRSVMTVRHRMVTVRANASRDEFVRLVRQHNYSRLPVYQDDPARIVGIVSVLDVLAGPPDAPLTTFMREPLTLRPDEPVPSALLRMRQARCAMAIVTDASGRCLGLATVKDLVEQIVGNLPAW